jgi:hypothetical protein
VYRAKRRRAAIAAQAAARRRTVIALMLCLLGLVAAVAVQEREGRIQTVGQSYKLEPGR